MSEARYDDIMKTRPVPFPVQLLSTVRRQKAHQKALEATSNSGCLCVLRGFVGEEDGQHITLDTKTIFEWLYVSKIDNGPYLCQISYRDLVSHGRAVPNCPLQVAGRPELVYSVEFLDEFARNNWFFLILLCFTLAISVIIASAFRGSEVLWGCFLRFFVSVCFALKSRCCCFLKSIIFPFELPVVILVVFNGSEVLWGILRRVQIRVGFTTPRSRTVGRALRRTPLALQCHLRNRLRWWHVGIDRSAIQPHPRQATGAVPCAASIRTETAEGSSKGA